MFVSRFVPLLLASLLCAGALPAQQSEVATGPATTDSTGRIHLDVVVTPKSGMPVTGLHKQDFTLLDNKNPLPLTSFRAVEHGSGDPVSVVIVIDAVNAPYQSVSYSRQQIEGFLKANGGHLAHPTSIAFFTDTGTQIQPGFTSDGNALNADLNNYVVGLRTLRRNTGFYGAADRFQLSVTTLRQLTEVESRLPGRKIVLWVSPGWPLLSGPGIYLDAKQQKGIFADVVDLSTRMRQARMTLYGLDPIGPGQSLMRANYYQTFLKGVSKPGQVDIADLSLQVLAVQTGGIAFTSNNDVAGMMQRTMDDTTAYYELTFDSPPADNRDVYHSVEIQVSQPGLTARTRTGYYAQPHPGAPLMEPARR